MAVTRASARNCSAACAGRRLAEETVAELPASGRRRRQICLIARRYRKRFLRASSEAISQALKAGSLLHSPLVDLGGHGFEVDAGIGQQRLPRALCEARINGDFPRQSSFR